MAFFTRIFKQLTAAPQDDPNAVWIYAQCDRCGEKLRARINTRAELSPEFSNTDNATSFYCRKVLIGEQRCFQQIEINVKFNNRFRIIEKEISGGKFITRDEFEQN